MRRFDSCWRTDSSLFFLSCSWLNLSCVKFHSKLWPLLKTFRIYPTLIEVPKLVIDCSRVKYFFIYEYFWHLAFVLENTFYNVISQQFKARNCCILLCLPWLCNYKTLTAHMWLIPKWAYCSSHTIFACISKGVQIYAFHVFLMPDNWSIKLYVICKTIN